MEEFACFLNSGSAWKALVEVAWSDNCAVAAGWLFSGVEVSFDRFRKKFGQLHSIGELTCFLISGILSSVVDASLETSGGCVGGPEMGWI